MSEKPKRFELRLAPEQWVEIDEWRRRQPDLPNRITAIRRLIDAGLKADQKPREAAKS